MKACPVQCHSRARTISLRWIEDAERRTRLSLPSNLAARRRSKSCTRCYWHIPTAAAQTPFLLLAAYGFQKSSPRLHNWLVSHPTFGPAIEDWQQHGAISRTAKIQAMLALAAVLGLSFLLGVGWLVLSIQIGVLMCVAAFILSRPSRPGE